MDKGDVFAGKQVPDAVSIGQGIPSFDLPEYIKEGLIKRIRQQCGINRYSLQPGMPELKHACAARIKQMKEYHLFLQQWSTY